MRRQQNGITFIGWLVLLVPVALVGYAAIRLAPVYLNYMKVAKAMERVAEDSANEESISPVAVQRALQRQYDVESIDYPPAKELAVRREGNDWVIEANYEDVVPLFAGISLLVRFDKVTAIK